MHVFFFNDTATTEIYTLSLHDALPISEKSRGGFEERHDRPHRLRDRRPLPRQLCRRSRLAPGASLPGPRRPYRPQRSEEHTSELQSRQYLVCRLLLEKKNTHTHHHVLS